MLQVDLSELIVPTVCRSTGDVVTGLVQKASVVLS